MTQSKKMIGVVTRPLYSPSCYVRVNIPNWETSIPLSIKASFSHFNRRDFEKGDVVEVEWRTPGLVRRYQVVRLLKEVKNPINVPDVDAFKENQSMSNPMSKDRVRITIGYRYFDCNDFASVLYRAFGTTINLYEKMRDTARSDGVAVIICRPSQFARFMIYRNEAKITNGFMDLNPKLFTPEPKPDVFALLAEKLDVRRDKAREIACFFGQFDHERLMERVAPRCSEPQEYDISRNKHTG